MNRPHALRTVLLNYPLLYCPSATCALYCPPVPICYLCTVLSSSPQLRVHISLQTASTLSGTSCSEARFSFFENFKFWSRPGPWLNVLNRKTWIWLCRFQSNLDIYWYGLSSNLAISETQGFMIDSKFHQRFKKMSSVAHQFQASSTIVTYTDLIIKQYTYYLAV